MSDPSNPAGPGGGDVVRLAAKDLSLDPYLTWMVATRFADFDPDVRWFPVLLELRQGETAQGFARSVADPAANQDWILIPSLYLDPPRGLAAEPATSTALMALVARDALVALTLGSGPRALVTLLNRQVGKLERLEIGSPGIPPFKSEPAAPLAAARQAPPQRAIVAVIDDGLAFGHARFRTAAGRTRFKYFWNQDDVGSNQPPPDVGWGRELTEADINQQLAACTHAGLLDEDELYAATGQQLVARRAKHGTHVMDLAGGEDPREVTAQSPYLIGVQLPRATTRDTSGQRLGPHVALALDYILSRADRIAAADGTAALPVVVNLSYGMIAGPHDGTTPLERKMDGVIAARAAPLRIVLPAGNYYPARCHARLAFDDVASNPAVQALSWRVQPDDRLDSFMEIWLPATAAGRDPARIAVRVTTPTGVTGPWIGPGESWPFPSANDVRFLAQYIDLSGAGGRAHLLLGLAPTASALTPDWLAPAGTWTVEVMNRGPQATIDAWVQRGDTPFGYPLRGRQSRFEDPSYVRFDFTGRPQDLDNGASVVIREGTISPIATGKSTIVVGGFRRSDRHAALYTAAGPIDTPPGRARWRTGPDVTAVADDSPALPGVLAAGTRTGAVFAMNGSSVAAAQVTRLIARRMTAGLTSDRAALEDAADPSAPLLPSPERGGAGRLATPSIERVPRWTKWP